MRKLILLSVIILGLAQAAVSQYLHYDIVRVMDYFDANQMTESKNPNMLNEQNFEGTPYLDNDFIKGTVYTTSKQKIVDIPIRYNIYNDDLEFKTPDNKIVAVKDPATIELADFGKYKLCYTTYSPGQKKKSGFLKIIEDGNATLYAKTDITFQKEQPGDGIKPPKPAKFKSSPDTYYISKAGGTAVRINNKKDLISILKDREKEISVYIKSNHVKISQENQLQELVKYYNSL